MTWGVVRIRALWALVVAAVGVLSVVASRAEAERTPDSAQPWLVPLVGLLLFAAAAAMRGQLLSRALLAATAVCWLLGSLSNWLLLTHQGCLLLVLLATAGLLRGRGWVLAGLALPIALGMVAQPAVGVAFLAVGAGAAWRRRTPAALAAGLAGLLLGTTLIVSWWVSRADPAAFDPYAAVLVYEGALVAAAVVLVLGSRAEITRELELLDRLLAGAGTTGLDGLGVVLADVLRAPGLQILRPPVGGDFADVLEVRVDDRVVAAVRHPVVGTLDAAPRASVAAAVALVVLGEERRAVVDAQALALRAAQRRLVTAQDEQRTATAARLHAEVAAPLRAAADALDGASARDDPVAAGAVAVARTQILDAAAEVEALVHGAGPSGLDPGRLPEALRDMASRSPVRVDLLVGGTVTASREVEATLYYVFAEALVNVHRHAHATAAQAVLEGDASTVRLTISDDGVGGADPRSSGLTGLADRVAMHGGRLRVVSPPGAGTVLTVEVPHPPR
jgi:signal transduction histidine kinase